MPYTAPIQVRFSERSDIQLADIANQTGLTKAELIRIAVDEFIANTEERGEVVQRHPMSKRKGKGQKAKGDAIHHSPPAPLTNPCSSPPPDAQAPLVPPVQKLQPWAAHAI